MEEEILNQALSTFFLCQIIKTPLGVSADPNPGVQGPTLTEGVGSPGLNLPPLPPSSFTSRLRF